MANIFISYGDVRFKESLNRIARQAKKVGIFDKIIKYCPKDLPDYIVSSPLFAFAKGGGYWAWKPYFIYHTLLNCKEGDLVWYIDAGCTLDEKSIEWKQFQALTQTYTAIFFQYRDGVDYGWQTEVSKTAIEYWTKPAVISYFKQFIDDGFLGFGKIWGGFMIFRKTEQASIILDQWLKITLFHPEFVIDPFGDELHNLPDSFYAHRHDQSILTPLIYHYRLKDNVLVLPETSESRIGHPAVLATRWIQGKLSWRQQIKYNLWRMIHGEP